MREEASDRTSVASILTDGLIRIRTPEGQEIHLTLERACEWLCCPRFRDHLALAVNSMPVPFGLSETP